MVVPARFRIQKCCRLCGRWELRDRRRKDRKVARFGTFIECVTRMEAIMWMEQYVRENGL